MMRPTTILLAAPLAVLGLATLTGAQGTSVVPPQLANQDGNSVDREPFGSDRMRHVQYVHRSLLLGVPTTTTIKSIAYRRDAQAARTTTWKRLFRNKKVKPLWTLQLGNLPLSVNIQNPSVLYPRQGQQGFTVVINGKAIDFPDLVPPPAQGPAPWAINLVFDRPFTYTGGHLVVDHFAFETRNANYSYFVDAVEGSPGAGGKADLISPSSLGCPPNENRAVGLAPNPGAGDLELFLFGARAKTRAFAALGASSTSWAGQKLPLDLGPILALPGCKVYTDYTAVTTMKTTSAGIAEFRAPVPASKTLLGASLFGQWIVVDDRVNPVTNLATSDGIKFTLGKQLGGTVVNMSVVSGIGNAARSRTGFVQLHRGIVFRLAW